MANKKTSEKQKMLAEQRKAKRRESEKTERKKSRRKKGILAAAICVVSAAVIAGGCVWAVKTQPLTHMLPVEKTEHYSLNAAEISFYSWQIYQQYLNNNTSSSDKKPDAETALSKQNYDNDTTWEAYFTDAARDYAQNILILCEAAHEANYTPDEAVTGLAKSALDEFDSSTFPSCVKDEDVTHAMELYLTAWDYSQYIRENISVTEEEMEDYYTDPENTKTMQVCSYESFSFAYDDSSETALSSTEAQELARDLRRCNTRDSFEKWVHDYYAENTTLTEEELQSQVSTLYAESMGYTEGDSLSEWAFSGDAKAGDTTILTDDTNKKITVALLVSEPERDEACPVTLRQILFTSNTYGSSADAKAAAEDMQKQWEAGDRTEDSFASLASSYSEDTSTDGGLYSNVPQGQMITSWKQWCFDPSRKAGDVTVLNSTYGACLVYYVSADTLPSWEQTATDALTEEHYADQFDTFEKNANLKTSDTLMKLVKADSQK